VKASERDLQVEWLSRELSPEALVPEVYAEWRPLVRDAFAFLAANLSEARWRDKIAQQRRLPTDAPAAQRLLCLLERMPALQKIGQILARNRHLDAELAGALVQLENEISDASPAALRATLLGELGDRVKRHRIEFEPTPLAEASVAAVVAFRWREPGPRRAAYSEGVFKVLKPGIPALLREDLELLGTIANFLDKRRASYGLRHVRIGQFFQEVRGLLGAEVQFEREQRQLVAAAERCKRLRGIDVPALIPALCTSRVTAMERVRGRKVTALHSAPAAVRRRVGARMLQALLLAPLLAAGDEAVFHADPHAGNLLWDAKRDRLVLLDWSLTDELSSRERRHLLRWTAAIGLRDEGLAWRSLRGLLGNRIETEVPKERLRRVLSEEMGRLSLLGAPDDRDWLVVLDELARAGAPLPRSLVMFRKTLFTLDGVLASMKSPATLATALLDLPGPARLPLLPIDWIGLAWSVASLPTRSVWRWNESAWRQAWRSLETLVRRDRPDSV